MEAQQQRSGLVYSLMFLMGLGILFPWNTVISTTSYWDSRMCGTVVAKNYMFFISFTFNLSNAFGIFLCLFYSKRFNVYPIRTRVTVPIVIVSLLFVFITLCTLFTEDKLSGIFIFASTMVCTVLCGFNVALFQTSMFGLSGMLNPIYTQAIMGGQGFAGITIAFTNYLTQLAGSPPDTSNGCVKYNEIRWDSFVFFLLSTVILLFCVVGFIVLDKHPMITPHTHKAATVDVIPPKKNMQRDSKTEPLMGDVSEDEFDDSIETLIPHKVEIPFVLSKIKWFMFGVYMVFLVTLMMFPTVTARIESTTKSDNRFFKDLWVPLSFVNFNLFDFIGRMSAGWFHVNRDSCPWIPLCCVFRLVFCFLFLACESTSSFPVWFDKDWESILIMVLFAFTNGLFSSLCMMIGPQQLEGKAQGVAGGIMAFGINLGLTSGAALSFSLLFLYPKS